MRTNYRINLKRRYKYIIAISFCVFILAFAIPTTLNDFFFPGSQPLDSGKIDGPSKCSSCHGGYDKAVEPTFNWTGSMMAQAQRDPLYLACLAISNQDVPFSGDICIRCHTPEGWLNDRSTPTDGSALIESDLESIHCGFCHRLVRPAEPGQNYYPTDSDYTSGTYPVDQTYLLTIDSIPVSVGNGSYVVDSDGTRRGPFIETGATHAFHYSPFHSESALCGTCHDVSNPAFDRMPDGTYEANDFDKAAPSFDTYDLFPVERTYSEWLMSEYNSETGVYAPQFGGNKTYVSSCQDCHMKDLSGRASGKPSAIYRTDLPHHDMTGGNTFLPGTIHTLFPDIDAEALDSGVVRARYMLQNAASIGLTVNLEGEDLVASIRITNETGHKLPSGYPEGRRIWINLVARDQGGSVLYESGQYDNSTAVLTQDEDTKIYEIKPGMDAVIAGLNGFEEGPSFHFVLNNKIFYDNRIPPRGFTNTAFEAIQSPPVGYTYADGQYWDDTEYILPEGTALVEASLLYQTTSKEYVEFLRDENVTNDAGQVFYDLWAAAGKSEPELMAFASEQVYSTSLADNLEKKLKVYPNPATDRLWIIFPDKLINDQLYISLFNSSGQLVKANRRIEISNGQSELSLDKLIPGRYIYSIETSRGDRKYSGSIIVK